ncbi:MAG: hypothetical protein ACRDQ5_08330 [Sciscionella sp.]
MTRVQSLPEPPESISDPGELLIGYLAIVRKLADGVLSSHAMTTPRSSMTLLQLPHQGQPQPTQSADEWAM